MQKQLIVFPTSRSIRESLSHCEDGFLPTYSGMGDFLDRAVRGGGKIIPDDDLRLLALHEASNFKAFDALRIERNFFTFIQNSSYIFRFFEEISTEMVGIEALEGADVYGEYEEHIAILKQLWQSYRSIVDEKGWADPIFEKSNIHINEGYIKGFDSIVIHVEGYLSRYELSVLRECASLVALECIYHATHYNEKMTQRFRLFGFEIEPGYRYQLNLSEITVVQKEKLTALSPIVCNVFQNKMTQVGFIKGEVQRMIREGIAPEKIVVVLPDESFATYLRLFDEEKNFNFAMGESLESEKVICDIEAIEHYIQEQNVENKARLERVPSDWVEWIKKHYYNTFELNDLEQLCAMMSERVTRDEVGRIIQEELHAFKSIVLALGGYEFKAALRIYLSRLKKRSLDDVGGGKITVMGLLETRGIAYDGVVVVDFNEGSVPHRSQKDLFLNTTTRRIADLPTTYERESLQKHYYWMLFQRSRSVALSCVHNTESIHSRFLIQLGIKMTQALYDYGSILFPELQPLVSSAKLIEGEYDFGAHPLSASSLKSFLTCKRQFYYRSIAKIKEHEMPQDLAQERDIGNRLHNAMEKLYTSCTRYESSEHLKEALDSILRQEGENDPMERYTRALWLEKLTPFYANELKRFSEGSTVVYNEKNLSCHYEGIELIGRIDRIDMSDKGLEVLDYKTGQFADTSREPKEGDTDYQLAIYALLARELGNVHRCGFYDLQSGQIHYEQFLEEKIEMLRTILKSLREQREWIWEMCDELKHCRFCTYAVLCHREL